MISKKGEITTAEIVMIIVLVVSFIILLYFLWRLSLGGTTNAEICHNSVVLQARSAHLAPGGLQCKTDYVCISGGGTCANMNPTITINVDPTNTNQIMQAIAGQMTSCWYEFGEGNLDYLQLNLVQQSVAGSGGTQCGVCSVIGFDNTIKNSKPFSTLQDCLSYYQGTVSQSQICSSMFSSNPATPYSRLFSYQDLLNFLANNEYSNSQTYLQYLYGVSSIQNLISPPSGITDFWNSGVIDTGSQFAIITGESKGGFSFWRNGQYLKPVFLKITDISNYLGNQCVSYFTQAS
jgi:hypothetical protein